MKSKSVLSIFNPNFPWVLGIGSFLLFMLTRAKELTVGIPAQITCAVANLYPIPITAHQPYVFIARFFDAILPGQEVFSLTFLSCLLGAASVVLFYHLMMAVPVIYTNVERLPSGTVARAQRITAAYSALFLVAAEPFWRAATQPDTLPFRVFLLLLSFFLLLRYGNPEARSRLLYLSAFVYGFGVTEYPSMMALAPAYGVACFLQMLRRGQLTGGTIVRLIGAGVVGLLFYLIPPLVLSRTPDFGYGEYEGFWGVILDLWRKQYVEMKIGIPRVGGILVFLAAFAPWLFIFFVVRPGQIGSVLARTASVITLFILTILGSAMLGGYITGPFQVLSPGHILAYLSMASWMGYLVGHWWLRVRAPTPVRGPTSAAFIALRFNLPYAAWILPFVIAFLNFSNLRSAAMTDFTQLTRNILASCEDRTFIVALGGAVDDLLRYFAKQQGAEPIILAPRELSRASIRKYLSIRYPTADLNLSGDMTVENTLRALFDSDTNMVNTVAMIRPEYAVSLGLQFIPNGLVVLPAPDLASFGAEQVYAANRKFFIEDFAPQIARLKATAEKELASTFIAREYSRCANNVGTTLRLLQNNALADDAFQWALDIFPDNPSALLNRRDLILVRIAAAEKSGQKTDELKNQADEALKHAFTFAHQHRELMADPLLLTSTFGYMYSERMSLDLADRFRKANMQSAEATAIEQARMINPESLSVRHSSALLFLGQGSEERAEKEYQTILEQAPADIGARIGLAAIAYDRKQLDSAIALLTDPQVNREDPRVITLLAVLYGEKGDRAKAKALFEEAQKLKLDNALAQSFMAMAALRLGDLQQATDYAQKSLVLNPGSAPMLYVLRDAARARGDLQGLWNVLTQLRAADPDNIALQEEAITLSMSLNRWTDTKRLAQVLTVADPGNFIANMSLASAAAQAGNLQEQERCLKVAVQAKGHPLLPMALNNLAYCLIQQGRFDEALPYAEDAVHLNPQFDKALHTLATAQLGLKQYAAAEQTILLALTLAPTNPQHILLHAEIAMAQGKTADARAYASQAMPELEDTWRARAEKVLQQAGQ